METHFPFTESADLASRTAQLQSDLKVVVRDIEDLLKTAAGQLNEKTATQLGNVLDRARHLGRQLEGRTAAGLEQADRMIREHPYPSLGIAFALGALVGVLINRK